MIQSGKIFISDRIKNPGLQDFFHKTLEGFQNELQHLADMWYNFPFKGIPGENEVFALIERSFVGLFNNSVVRNFPIDAVLQEYSIDCGNKKYKRADYLVKHFYRGEELNILFEAKQRAYDGKSYSENEIKEFLKPFIEQAKSYYEVEKQYIKGQTWVASLVFEWVRYPELVEKVHKYDEEEDDGVTDFYCFFHTEQSGLMVYGNLNAVKS